MALACSATRHHGHTSWSAQITQCFIVHFNWSQSIPFQTPSFGLLLCAHACGHVCVPWHSKQLTQSHGTQVLGKSQQSEESSLQAAVSAPLAPAEHHFSGTFQQPLLPAFLPSSTNFGLEHGGQVPSSLSLASHSPDVSRSPFEDEGTCASSDMMEASPGPVSSRSDWIRCTMSIDEESI